MFFGAFVQVDKGADLPPEKTFMMLYDFSGYLYRSQMSEDTTLAPV